MKYFIYEKLSQKCKESIYASFMHEKPTYTCCISENVIMACYILNLGFAYEPLVHMDFNQIDARCIRANHSIFEMSSSCIILLHMVVY